jgi:hypothetical protein
MTLENALDSFARVARPIIRRSYAAASCIASTRITIDVMRALGFVASPLAVMLYVGNPAFRESLSDDDLASCAERYEGRGVHRPRLVRVGGKLRRGDLGAHVVAVADDRYLVDASFDQVHLPQYGIIPPPILVSLVDPRLVRGSAPQRMEVNGLLVEYRRQYLSTRFLHSPNWRGDRDTRASVRAILTAMDADPRRADGHRPPAGGQPGNDVDEGAPRGAMG